MAERCRQLNMMANIEIKPTTGSGPLTGKVVALAARELWHGISAPLLSSFEIDARKWRSRRCLSCRAGCCWTSGVRTGAS